MFRKDRFKRSAFVVSNALNTIRNEMKCSIIYFLMHSTRQARDV